MKDICIKTGRRGFVGGLQANLDRKVKRSPDQGSAARAAQSHRRAAQRSEQQHSPDNGLAQLQVWFHGLAPILAQA
jgi:hypothetical protein